MKVKDTNVSDLPTNPPLLVPSQDVAASTQALIVVPEKQEESNVNLESGNDKLKLEEAATKVQAVVRSHQVNFFFFYIIVLRSRFIIILLIDTLLYFT